MPTLEDERFQHSVIYLCEHNSNGAMGLIINQPLANLTISNLLSKLDISLVSNESKKLLSSPIFNGGPLADDRGFILHTPQNHFASSIQISDEIMVTTSKDILDTLCTERQPQNVLVSLGYAGWQAGQLEQEIVENSWLTVAAEAQIMFKTPIAERWHAAAKTLGIDIHNIVTQAGHA